MSLNVRLFIRFLFILVIVLLESVYWVGGSQKGERTVFEFPFSRESSYAIDDYLNIFKPGWYGVGFLVRRDRSDVPDLEVFKQQQIEAKKILGSGYYSKEGVFTVVSEGSELPIVRVFDNTNKELKVVEKEHRVLHETNNDGFLRYDFELFMPEGRYAIKSSQTLGSGLHEKNLSVWVRYLRENQIESKLTYQVHAILMVSYAIYARNRAVLLFILVCLLIATFSGKRPARKDI